tara:strand:- start:2800 stop:3696 length:897 start_codon:yes stop_codon:yes gene_type:complete
MLMLEEDNIEIGIVPVFADSKNERPQQSAIFTIVRNDNFLEMWLINNAPQFMHVYVLFHQVEIKKKERELCAKYGASILQIYNESTCCWSWITDTINKFATWLMNSYLVVAYTDIDEIIVDPKGKLQNLNCLNDFVRFVGLDVIQEDDEKDINWDKPIMQQRRAVYCSTNACKIVLKKRAAYRWDSGQHKLIGEPYEILYGPIRDLPNLDPYIYLVHLHYFDRNNALERSSHRKNISTFEFDNGFGAQAWAPNMEAVKESFIKRRIESELLQDQKCGSFIFMDNPLDIIERIVYRCYK